MNHFATLKMVLTSLLLSMSCIVVFAQQTVSGTVIDDAGEPLIGVSIQVKGTTTGSITDFDGNFTLDNIASSDILVFSYVGYASKEIPVGNQKVLKVTLSEDTEVLDEVVVVGYGQMKKSDLTGSVSSADGSSLAAKGTTSAMEALQGTVPGVNITQSSGRTGGSFDVQIRGKSSINGDSSPLFVVDGVICDNIDFLNPQDIERMDILKDASSTAIYGSRATAGVVVVTTKSGATVSKKAQEDKVTISYDGYYGYSQVTRMPDFMDAQEFLNYRFMEFLGSGQFTAGVADVAQPVYQMTPGQYAQGMIFNDNGESVIKKFLANGQTYDWPSMVTQDANKTNHYVAVSGRGEKVNYHFGFGYNLEEGVYKGDRQDRFNIKGSVDAKINKVLSAGFNINLAYTNNDYASGDAVKIAFRQVPFAQPYKLDENGLPTDELNEKPANYAALGSFKDYQFTDTYNSLVMLRDDSKNSKKYRMLGNIYLQIKPLEWMTFKTTFSPNYVSSRTGEYTAASCGRTEAAHHEEYSAMEWTWDNQLDFNKTINGDHSINAMLLFSMNEFNRTYSEIGRSTTEESAIMTGTEWFNLYAGAADNENIGTSYYETKLMSAAARFNYSYKGRYMITATVRADGSSKFSKGNQWGWFPSAALAWRMSEENWMQGADWLTNLKWRLSYGVTGNNTVAAAYNMASVAGPSIYAFGNVVANGYYPSGVINSELSWEKSNEWNAGVDFGFLRDRITGSVDFYNKVSSDLLYVRSLPLVSGGGTLMDNVGSVLNRGVEVSLKTVNVDIDGWQWTTTFNFAYNHNEVLSINGEEDKIISSSNPITKSLFVGESVNNIYSYNWDGIVSDKMITVPDNEAATNNGFTPGSQVRSCDYYHKVYGWNEGMPIIEDHNGDGVIDDNDKYVLGSQDPKWTGSVTSTLTWKGWDLSFTLYTKQDYTIYSPFLADNYDYNYRGWNNIAMDYYIPAGTLIGCDGVNADGTYINPVYQEETHYGSYPMPRGVGNYYGMGDIYYNKGVSNLAGIKKNVWYWKFKNITLGYNFPKKWLDPWKCQSLRLYVNITNPFCWSNYEGFDPEWAGVSMENDAPSTVTYQVGASIKF